TERADHKTPPTTRRDDAKGPGDLEQMVLKTIARAPGERYATAEALGADLENYLADKPIAARRSSPAERAWRWCRRNKAAAGLLAARAVAALGLVGFPLRLVGNPRGPGTERPAAA